VENRQDLDSFDLTDSIYQKFFDCVCVERSGKMHTELLDEVTSAASCFSSEVLVFMISTCLFNIQVEIFFKKLEAIYSLFNKIRDKGKIVSARY
jgi:hypothetical protein